MATKTSPSSRRTASRTSASRKASSSGRKAAPKKKPAPKKPAAKKKPARASTRQILSPFARDAVGIALVVFAGLAVLSVWFDLAGPMGQAMTDLLQSGFGLLAVAIPVIGVFWGFVLLRDVAPEDRVRMFIGFGLLTVGVLGMLSIVRGNPGCSRRSKTRSVRRAWAMPAASSARSGPVRSPRWSLPMAPS